jgi:hypothetical protein
MSEVDTISITDQWGNEYIEVFEGAFEFGFVNRWAQDGDGNQTLIGSQWGIDAPVQTRDDLHDIIREWCSNAEEGDGIARVVEFFDSAGIWVVAAWDGGSMVIDQLLEIEMKYWDFGQVVRALELTVVVTWKPEVVIELTVPPVGRPTLAERVPGWGTLTPDEQAAIERVDSTENVDAWFVGTWDNHCVEYLATINSGRDDACVLSLYLDSRGSITTSHTRLLTDNEWIQHTIA